MTETKWLACGNPDAMLEFLLLRKLLKGKESERKLRLLACAACRRQWARFQPHSRAVIEVNERYADSASTHEQVLELIRVHRIVDEDGYLRYDCAPDERYAELISGERMLGRMSVQTLMSGLSIEKSERRMIGRASTGTVDMVQNGPSDEDAGQRSERKSQAALIREIFGNPFRPAKCRKSWLRWNSRTIPNLAEAIYEEWAFDRLPILGDALEDAGCTNPEVLNHCRQRGEHFRGCWVVDLLLGKA